MKSKFLAMFDTNTLTFLKHGKNYVGASFLTTGLSVISIPIMTRLLSPSDYGIVAVFTSVVAILSILFTFGLDGAVSRYYYESEMEFPVFYGTVMLSALIVSAIGICLVLIFRKTISNMVNLPSLLVPLGAVAAFCTTAFSLAQAYLTASMQSRVLSRITVSRGVLSLVLMIIITMALSDEKYMGPVWIQVIFGVLYLFLSIKIFRAIGIVKFSRVHFKWAMKYSSPLILHALSSYLLNTFGQIMVNKMVGSTEAGIYSFAYKVGMLFQLVLMGLNQSWVPIFFDKMKQNAFDDIEVTARKFTVLISGIALTLVAFAPIVVKVLASSAYSTALPLVPVIIIGFIFFYLYQMYGLYAAYANKNGAIAISTVFAGGLNIALNLFFIPRYGFVAAAWSTLFSFVFLFVAHYCNVRFFVKPKRMISLKRILMPAFWGVGLIVFLMVCEHLIDVGWILYLLRILTLLMFIVPFAIRKRYS